MSKKSILILVVAGGFLLLSCLGALSLFLYVDNLRNEGIEKEVRLSAQYQDNQNYLAAFISGFYEKAGVLTVQSETINNILLDTVKGRYDEGGFSTGSAMFAVIVEAYPEESVSALLENWSDLQDHISAGREGYRNKQSLLLDMLADYDEYLQKNYIRSLIVRLMGFPSDNLRAQIGTTQYFGRQALERMRIIVLSSETLEAYDSGILEPLTIP